MLSVLQRVGRSLPCGPALAAAAVTTFARAFTQGAGPSPSGLGEKYDDLYKVVGCAASASRAELKRCFQQRAKELHPDVAAGSHSRSHDAFAQLLAAYKVLADPRSRQLYDMRQDHSGPSVLRAAATSGVQGSVDASYEEVEFDLSWGLGSIFKQPPPSDTTVLDQVHQELQGELHSAVRHAYLGLRLQHLDASCLPDAFEADERAAADCPDLLQLVNGRQLLGYVRERRLELLARQQEVAALRKGWTAAAVLSGRGQGQLAEAGGGAQQQEERQEQEQEQRQQQPQQQREPDVLDLYLGEQVLASAVRHFPLASDSSADGPRRQAAGVAGAGAGSASAGEHLQQTQQQMQQAQQQQPLPAEVIGIYGRGGELLAQVETQQLDPGSSTASSARLLNATGLHTHTVYRTQTLLVRHLTFVAEPGASRLRTRRRLVVCYARRAWLPPSSLWLFKPLAYTHDIGGWCLEWAGHAQHHHPAWLDPAVLLLTAAFDSLDHERQGRQPLGLFARIRAAAAAAAQEGGAGGEACGGWRGWATSMLRFHGRGKS